MKIRQSSCGVGAFIVLRRRDPGGGVSFRHVGRAGKFLNRRTNIVFFDLSIESAQPDTEHSRGLPPIPIAPDQSLPHDRPFYLRQGHSDPKMQIGTGRKSGPDPHREGVELNLAASLRLDKLADHAFQFPDISGPIILSQTIHRWPCELLNRGIEGAIGFLKEMPYKERDIRPAAP